MERGYDGALDIICLTQNIIEAQVLLECFEDEYLDKITEWLMSVNPYALEEMSRRLLELESRGKWGPDADVLDRLRQSCLVVEGDIESRLESKGRYREEASRF
ncbi:MAG: cobaltochelatase subunit CobN [Eubacteriaceae bacterium]|nr:cobaltochelatase subunit CobN [Eubacteriaceae bacterium]